jgi:hypothetical protein
MTDATETQVAVESDERGCVSAPCTPARSADAAGEPDPLAAAVQRLTSRAPEQVLTDRDRAAGWAYRMAVARRLR